MPATVSLSHRMLHNCGAPAAFTSSQLCIVQTISFVYAGGVPRFGYILGIILGLYIGVILG